MYKMPLWQPDDGYNISSWFRIAMLGMLCVIGGLVYATIVDNQDIYTAEAQDRLQETREIQRAYLLREVRSGKARN